MITRSKYSFDSRSKAKAWVLDLGYFKEDFRLKRDAAAAESIAKLLPEITEKHDGLHAFFVELECIDFDGNSYDSFRTVMYDGNGRFRIVSENKAMERDEVVEAVDLLSRIQFSI